MTPSDAPFPGADSVFDPNTFMSMTTEGVGSTTVTPIPAGEHLAIIGIGENDVKPVPYKDSKTNEAKVRLEVTFDLHDPDGRLKAELGRDPRYTESYFLEFVPGTYTLDMGKGKNVRLNRLREAVGQNTGAPWAPPMLRGAGPVKLQMAIQPDKQDPSIPRNSLKAIGRVG